MRHKAEILQANPAQCLPQPAMLRQ